MIRFTRWLSDAAKVETAAIALLFVVWAGVYLLAKAGVLV